MDHDQSYKLLFSHPEMVADLLRGFVHEDWVQHLDFDSLEKVSGTYVADDLREREDDVIWKVRWGQDWLYVYLLIEFQSTVDRYMAIRILVYLGLLYQDLVRTGSLAAEGRLPPVLPIVLYNGSRRWDAPVDVADLVVPMPGGLESYRPRLKYFLLDEGRYADSELAPLRNLAAALFRMENSRTPQDVEQVLAALAAWLQAPEQTSLRRAFTVWLKRVFLPGKLPGVELGSINDLQEVQSMLAERVTEWTEEWKQQGRKEGLKEGEAAMLIRLLELRFGGIDETTQARIRRADAETLLLWGERVLTAASLAEVFKP